MRCGQPVKPTVKMAKLTVRLALLLLTACLAGGANAAPPQPYTWRNVAIVAGGFMPGIEFSPKEPNLIFIRADIGGAYRWNATDNRWIPLTDWADADNWNRNGIESIAPDPTDANRVYIASGTYTSSWAGNGAILRSDDRGDTWQITPMPFKMGGNEDGRSIGERLAVDPHSPNILYLGTRHDGLWKSTDRGATWAKVQTFPFQGRRRDYGVGFIVFAPDSPSIFVGVADGPVHLYRSADDGETWTPVEGQPAHLLPHHGIFTPDGLLYLTYTNGPGPNNVTNGAVFVYDTHAQTWTDITPLKPGSDGHPPFGYAGLSIDAQHPQTIMVSTIDRWNPGDDIFRTTDGGKTWKALSNFSQRDASASPYLYWGRPTLPLGHWIGSVEIDPFNSDHVLYVTGATVWGCNDITQMDRDQTTHWKVAGNGIEETAVLDLLSLPAGPHLISALGDLGGFRHDDLDVSPPDGMSSNPIMTSTRCLDFAASVPAFVVRVGDGQRGRRGAFSLDAGATWQPFASDPPSGRGGGSIAVSCDGRTLIWSPANASVWRSSNRGVNWTASQGIDGSALLLADPSNPNDFYAISPDTGASYVSHNGGVSFTAQATNLPRPYSKPRLWPGRDGTILLPAGDQGLYCSTDSGQSFSKWPLIQSATAIGFGKSAPNHTEPAVYLAGKIDNTNGFFRSDDSGATWTRINDDRHQYGLITVVIGDPRIFGRVYVGTNGRGILYADIASP